MVSDLWGTQFIFTVLDGIVDNTVADEKGTIQLWKVDVNIRNNSPTADKWFSKSSFCLLLSFIIKIFCITDSKEKPQT
jgi:hypothetical protein